MKPFLPFGAICWWVSAFLVVNSSALLAEKTPTPHRAPPSIIAPFNEENFAPYKETGTASIAGQAFLVTKGKEVKHQPGGRVYLFPSTPHTDEWFRKYVVEQGFCKIEGLDLFGEKIPCSLDAFADGLLDVRVGPHVRETRANPTGHFWFRKLPPGAYYIAAAITWYNRSIENGGMAYANIEVDPGEHVTNVMVTR